MHCFLVEQIILVVINIWPYEHPASFGVHFDSNLFEVGLTTVSHVVEVQQHCKVAWALTKQRLGVDEVVMFTVRIVDLQAVLHQPPHFVR